MSVEQAARGSEPTRGGGRARAALVLSVLVLVWVAAGIRQLDPSSEWGVIDGPLPGLPVRTERALVVVPPGLARLTRYPRGAVELALPSAESAWLPGSDGSRYGLTGTATVRPRESDWRKVHATARGRGLAGVLVDAVRDSGVTWPARWRRGGRIPPALARDLRDGLARELDLRGVDLEQLRASGFDFLRVGPGTPSPEPLGGTRVLVLALDGADWQILDPLMEQGRLPHLARLTREGVRAKLLSISPMLSPVVWTTVATGVEPSRHGILDFLVPGPEGQPREPVTSRDRRVPTIWQMLSRAGSRVGVVAWWASWPAEPVDGYVVSDRVAYQLFGYRSEAASDEGKVWPPDLYPEVRSRIVDPDGIPWADVAAYLSGPRTARDALAPDELERVGELRTLLASGRTYFDIARDLSSRFDPRFEAVYFEGTDTVGHLFMSFRPPELPGVGSKARELFGEVVDRYYETIDGYVGSILEGRGSEWTVVVLSDHGFVSDEGRPQTTDSRIGHGAAADWHRRFGVLILSGARIREGVRVDEASVYDVAPTILALFGQPVPASWPGRVLAEALDPSFLERHPVRYRTDDPVLEREAGAGESAARDPAAEEILSKLETLGYIGSESDSEPAVTHRNNAGVALMAEGRYAEAEREFRAALESDRVHPAVLVNLAYVLRLQGRPDEARPYLETALDFPAAHLQAGLGLARLELDAGRPEPAETVLRAVLEREPGSAEARATLGQALELRGDPAGAAREYRRAAELDPDAALPRNNLGNLAKRAGRDGEAERWYLEAIEADPYFLGAYNNLALVYQERGEIDRAIELYARAREKAPANAVVLNNLASLHYATGDLERARLLWRQAAGLDPSYPSPLSNLGGLAIAEGSLDEAELLLRRALALEPGYGDARLNLALVHARRGDRDAARAELELAAEDARSRPKALAQLGLVELEGGDPVEALQRLQEAQRLDPASTAALNGIGEAYRLLGRPDEAERAWRESLRVDPGQDDVRRRLRLLHGGAESVGAAPGTP